MPYTIQYEDISIILDILDKLKKNFVFQNLISLKDCNQEKKKIF